LNKKKMNMMLQK